MSAVELTPDMPFRVYIGQVIEERFDVMMTYRAGTIAGRDPEDLHKMRVSSRRLRAAMDVAVVCFPKRYSYFHSTVKELTDVLGGVRDCDVLREALMTYRETRPVEDHPGINRMLARIRVERTEHRVHLVAFFERLEQERFETRFRGFLAEHARG